jgi:hypothetical protein
MTRTGRGGNKMVNKPLRNQGKATAFPWAIDPEVRFCSMVQSWSAWKRFPDAYSGGHVEAPIGPGVYEVRHSLTGRVIAFGPSGNVAQALSELKVNGGLSPLTRLFRKQSLVPRVADLEYRTCAATSRAEAKTAAHRLLGLRQTAWAARMPG